LRMFSARASDGPLVAANLSAGIGLRLEKLRADDGRSAGGDLAVRKPRLQWRKRCLRDACSGIRGARRHDTACSSLMSSFRPRWRPTGAGGRRTHYVLSTGYIPFANDLCRGLLRIRSLSGSFSARLECAGARGVGGDYPKHSTVLYTPNSGGKLAIPSS